MQFLLNILKRNDFMMIGHSRFRPRPYRCKSVLIAAFSWDVSVAYSGSSLPTFRDRLRSQFLCTMFNNFSKIAPIMILFNTKF